MDKNFESDTVTRAFGKFDLSSPLPLRGFEKYFKIGAREGPKAWRSYYASVQNLLNHLSRFTKSESSREKYLGSLRRFCLWFGSNPDELVRLPQVEIEASIQNFVDGLAQKSNSRTYINSIIKRLKSFFRANGYDNLKVATYFVPTRYRKREEYIPSKGEVLAMANVAGRPKNRAIILVLWSSGIRVSTLCALNFSNIADEIKKGEPYIMLSVHPKMKERVPDACKGRIPYYTFVCPEAGEALRSYLQDRKEKYGKISSEDPLFHSDWTLWDRSERSSKRLGRRGVGVIVKRAARLAGVQRWRHVTPHCLRKSFESILRSITVDGGRLDKGTQEFFMGHILPGTQDVYYDKTKVEFHRKEYAKLDFSRSGMLRRMLDKLVDVAELERYLNDGWLFVAKISESKAVVRGNG